ncbi:hypothetical protein TNCV_2859261 [Trichonephila clavipes]|nr:hypothetical protein TNCV_2859261 [Trichonephila clavipes]
MLTISKGSSGRTIGVMGAQRLSRQLRETSSFHVTIDDVGRRRAVCSPSVEESIVNVVADRPKSSTRAVAPHVSMIHHTVGVPPVGVTAICTAAEFHSPCAEVL